MTGKKRSWVRPELTVLVRGDPGESVLTTCKNGVNAGEPEATEAACYYDGEPCMFGCDSVGAS